MREVKIYTISDADTGMVYYIGATVQHLKARLSGHLSGFSNVRKLNCKRVAIEELDIAYGKEEAQALESYWIAQFIAWGFPLINSKGKAPYKPRWYDESPFPCLSNGWNGIV